LFKRRKIKKKKSRFYYAPRITSEYFEITKRRTSTTAMSGKKSFLDELYSHGCNSDASSDDEDFVADEDGKELACGLVAIRVVFITRVRMQI
jgi:hypothetical protein